MLVELFVLARVDEDEIVEFAARHSSEDEFAARDGVEYRCCSGRVFDAARA
jgi:hypothetical protein